METQANDTPEFPWIAELRAAGYDIRTGSGELRREPDASLPAPPGLRSAVRRFVRNFWNGKIHRLTHPKRHAPVP
jgi:hypothetical protein